MLLALHPHPYPALSLCYSQTLTTPVAIPLSLSALFPGTETLFVLSNQDKHRGVFTAACPGRGLPKLSYSGAFL